MSIWVYIDIFLYAYAFLYIFEVCCICSKSLRIKRMGWTFDLPLRKSIWFQFFNRNLPWASAKKHAPWPTKKTKRRAPTHSGRYPKFQWEKGADIPRSPRLSYLLFPFSSCWGMPVRWWTPHVYPEEGTWNSFAFQQGLNPKISTKGCLSVIFEKRPPQFCHKKNALLAGEAKLLEPFEMETNQLLIDTHQAIEPATCTLHSKMLEAPFVRSTAVFLYVYVCWCFRTWFLNISWA